jgi:hypothetical protein
MIRAGIVCTRIVRTTYMRRSSVARRTVAVVRVACERRFAARAAARIVMGRRVWRYVGIEVRPPGLHGHGWVQIAAE